MASRCPLRTECGSWRCTVRLCSVSGGAVPRRDIAVHPPRLEYDLLAVVDLIPEHPVSLRCVVETHLVRDDEARVNLALLDPFEEGLHVPLHMTLPALDGQRPV